MTKPKMVKGKALVKSVKYQLNKTKNDGYGVYLILETSKGYMAHVGFTVNPDFRGSPNYLAIQKVIDKNIDTLKKKYNAKSIEDLIGKTIDIEEEEEGGGCSSYVSIPWNPKLPQQ